MPKITVLPHPEYSPNGATIETTGETTICDALLENGVEIEHACGKVGACTTCHVVVKQGFDLLSRWTTTKRTCWTWRGDFSLIPDYRARPSSIMATMSLSKFRNTRATMRKRLHSRHLSCHYVVWILAAMINADHADDISCAGRRVCSVAQAGERRAGGRLSCSLRPALIREVNNHWRMQSSTWSGSADFLSTNRNPSNHPAGLVFAALRLMDEE